MLLILRVSLHFLANRLALLRRRRLDTLTCRFSSLLILRVSLNFLADCLVLLRRSRLITLTSGVLLLLGQWLATAEVAEVVIAPIVFSFIKPLCRCLTLGISRNDGGRRVFVAETDLLPPDAGCRVLEQVTAWRSFRR